MKPISLLVGSAPQLSFDRVVFRSSASVGALTSTLPLEDLKRAAHSFNIVRYRGRDHRQRARIIAVGHSPELWRLLAHHESALKCYAVTVAEIAADFNAPEKSGPLPDLMNFLAKPWHRRRHLSSVHKPDEMPPPGCVAEPTIYFEDRNASVALKCYVRQRKTAGGGFGALCLRLEWTISGSRALKRHLGGNKIGHLLRLDPTEFLARHFRLEAVDHVALGRLFRGSRRVRGSRDTFLANPGTAWAEIDESERRARRAAFLVLRWLAYRDEGKFSDWGQALWSCQHSPAHIRGFLRDLRDGKRSPRRGRRRQRTTRRPITDHKINRCFHRVQLEVGYNYSCQLKITDHEPSIFKG